MSQRSYEQIKLYQGYSTQLIEAKEIKVDMGLKVWRGRLNSIRRDHARYMLKAFDLELPHTNPNYPNKSKNKNRFSQTDMADLTHHISFLREVLIDNQITPFNDKEYA